MALNGGSEAISRGSGALRGSRQTKPLGNPPNQAGSQRRWLAAGRLTIRTFFGGVRQLYRKICDEHTVPQIVSTKPSYALCFFEQMMRFVEQQELVVEWQSYLAELQKEAEEEDAVQESSTEEVSVQEQAEDSS